MLCEIIIVLLLTYIYYIYYLRPDYLTGFWVADDEFCDDADIKSILLYFSEPAKWSSARSGYLVIMDDICNQGFDITTGANSCFYSPYEYNVNASMKFDDDQIWPETVSLRCDMSTGKLLITSGNKILAALHKDNA